MAKGGLTPDHTLICPIAHYPSTVELPDVSCLNKLFSFEKTLILTLASQLARTTLVVV